MRFSKPIFSGLISVLLMLTAKQLHAQKQREYAILNSGDTVFCKMTRSIFGNISYTVNGGESTRLRPDAVKEYFFRKDKTPFVSKKLPNGDLEFLALLERGKINLYELSYQTAGSAGGPGGGGYMGGSSCFYYVQKKDSDSLYLIKSTSLINKNSPKERRAYFAEPIEDDEELHNKFHSKNSYSFKNLRQTINLYNKRSHITH